MCKDQGFNPGMPGDNIGFFFDEAQPEKILNLQSIDLFRPLPAEGLQSFDHWKTGLFNPTVALMGSVWPERG